MAKTYIQLNKPIKEISSEDLITKLGGQPTSVLMRTIILNEKEFLSVDYERSLRGFWYSTVKPTLDKLGLLTEKDQEEEKLSRWDAELSRYLAELVKMGVLSYKDLNIVDNSRQREAPNESYNTTSISSYGYKVQIAPYSNIIICTEKDTAYSIIKDLSSFFGCSCISGKGQNSLGAMEDLLREIKKRAGDNKPIYILTMTDYDPAGYYIADTFKNQIDDLSLILELKSSVQIKRIGITPNQLTPQEVEANKYSPKKANIEKWMQLTNGINGEPKGLELDAFSPARIREIFIQSIKPYIDTKLYYDFIKQSYLQKLILEAMQEKAEAISKDVTRDFINSIEADDFNLWDLAQQGHFNIPVTQLCSTTQQTQITNKVLSFFK
jgi:hypothetical protein